MKTGSVRRMRVPHFYSQFHHYEIEANDPIQSHHICSIILYCDFTAFCSRFSSTFRKLDRWETIDSVKERNAEFYWQSRYFREAVELFGDNGAEGNRGPFFCGVDRVMVLRSFRLRLCGPT